MQQEQQLPVEYTGPDPLVVDEDGRPAGVGPVRAWWIRAGWRATTVRRDVAYWLHPAVLVPAWWALARRAPSAVWMVGVLAGRWLWVDEVRQLQLTHAVTSRRADVTVAEQQKASAQYGDVDRLLWRKRAWRLGPLAGAGLLAGVAHEWPWPSWWPWHGGWQLPTVPGWCWVVALAVGLPVLGWLVVDEVPEAVAGREPELDEQPPGEVVAGWFHMAGITTWAGPSATGPVRLDCDPIRDADADGIVLRVWLPRGVTTAKVRQRWTELASAMQVNVRRLHLDDLDDQGQPENLIELFLANHDPGGMAPPAWPLASLTEWDVFKPVTIGWDARRRPIRVVLLWSHFLIAGLMTYGKSTTARAIVTAGALDPRVLLDIFNLKGSADWMPFQGRSVVYEDDARTAVPRLKEHLRWLDGEVKDRFDRMKREYGLSRLTPELARVFRPRFVVIDEGHEAIEDPVHGAEILRLLVSIAKLAPQCGVVIVFTTQKPGKKSLPTDLRNLFAVRICHAVSTVQDSIQVLGEAPSARGLNASSLTGRGVACIVALAVEGQPAPVGAEGLIAGVTQPVAESILSRLPGQRGVPAAADDADGQFLAAVLAAWPAGVDKAQTGVLADRLGVDRGAFRDRLVRLGVAQLEQVYGREGGRKTSRRGFARADVEAVRDAR